MKSCRRCDGKCCRLVCVPIETPIFSPKDMDTLAWALAHANISVAIGKDIQHDWNLVIETPCRFLSNGKCIAYDERFQICKDLTTDNCIATKEKQKGYTDTIFDNIEDVKKYLREKI